MGSGFKSLGAHQRKAPVARSVRPGFFAWVAYPASAPSRESLLLSEPTGDVMYHRGRHSVFDATWRSSRSGQLNGSLSPRPTWLMWRVTIAYDCRRPVSV